MRILYSIFILLIISACSRTEYLRPGLNVDSGPAMIKEQRGINKIKKYSDCSISTDVTAETNILPEQSAVYIHPSSTYQCALLESSADKNDPHKAVELLYAGVSLSNLICEHWFNDLENAQSSFDQVKGHIANTGLFTGAFLGLTETASKIIGGSSALFELALNTTNTEAEIALLAPDVQVTKKAVFAKRHTRKVEFDLKKDSQSLTYNEVISELESYHNICSRIGIRDLLSELLRQAATTLDLRASEIEADLLNAKQTFNNAEYFAIRNDLASLFNRNIKVMTESELSVLYNYFMYQDKISDEGKDLLKAQLIEAKLLNADGFNFNLKPNKSLREIYTSLERLKLISPLDKDAKQFVEKNKKNVPKETLKKDETNPS